jgi:hypothetical protein
VNTPVPPYLSSAELAAQTPWSVEAIRRMVTRGVLRRGEHYFQPLGARTQLLFKWTAIVALIERPEPGAVGPVGGPTRRVLDVGAASAALTRQLHTRGIAMDEDDGRAATS